MINQRILPYFIMFDACVFASMSYAEQHTDMNTSEPNQTHYILDDDLFRMQSNKSIKVIQKMSQNILSSGIYHVDIFVNGQYIRRQDVKFIEVNKNEIQPCFDYRTLEKFRITKQLLSKIPQTSTQCILLSDYMNSHTHFNFSKLRLDIEIAQDDLIHVPRGYVDPALWNVGSSIFFLNYAANIYHTSIESPIRRQQQTAGYLSLNGGINFGKWQYRQQLSLNSSHSELQWNNIRRYIVRPIEKIKGNLFIGQTYSSGQFFSSLRFTGLNISSDDRMLPQSMRGYAPVIKGIAKTNAKVSIYQDHREIYQISVAPGPFTISDLFPTNYSGDLQVHIEEADGSTSQFSVPFSAVPQSLRTGAFKYNIDVGKTKNLGDDRYFSNATLQYGLNNKMTLVSGLRVSNQYYAGLLGATYSDLIGTLGATFTYSHADRVGDQSLQGWMANLNFSKTFNPTHTTLTVAGYRYSEENYRDLNDVLGQRYALQHHAEWNPNLFQQRSRVDLTMNQSLGDFGMLFVSGSVNHYRDHRHKNIQAQMGYGKAFNNGVNLNLSLVRQYSTTNSAVDVSQMDAQQATGKVETSVNMSVSIPLGVNKTAKNQNAAFSYVNSGQNNNSYQTTFSAYTGDIHPLNYSVGASYDDQSKQKIFNANLGKRFSHMNTGLNVSFSDHFWQVSGNAQGALAIHSGGITFGQYLSDTFALIEAKGAEGAEVNYTQGSKVDRHGYALVSSLTPYQLNTISLNPVGTPYSVEIESSQDQIVPYAGAAVKVKFKTKIGYPLLIQATLTTGEFVPLGSEISNERGEILGVAGQNGLLYVRVADRQGILFAKWGDLVDEKCTLHYAIHDKDFQHDQPILRVPAQCLENQ